MPQLVTNSIEQDSPPTRISVLDNDFSTCLLPAVDMLYSFRRMEKEARVRKGFLVAIYEYPFGIAFPINPMPIKSKKNVNYKENNRLGQTSPEMLWTGSDTREISFSLQLDAYTTDFIVAVNQSDFDDYTNNYEQSAPEKGMARTLAQLELFNYPGNWSVVDSKILLNSNYYAPPRALFGFGDYLYLEVFVSTTINIVETTRNLEPLRATVDLTLKVVDESVSYINRLHLSEKIRSALAPEDDGGLLSEGIKTIYEYYKENRFPIEEEEPEIEELNIEPQEEIETLIPSSSSSANADLSIIE